MDFVKEFGDNAQGRVFNLLFNEDELTWQTMIYDLVSSEEMDPWDIDVSIISHKFIEMLKQLKEMNFRISGKIVLASAMLLKIKSKHLLEKGIVALDNLMAAEEDPIDLLEDLDDQLSNPTRKKGPRLVPKTPQPRKRKVSVYDLVSALEQALEVENRRRNFITPNVIVELPDKKKDMSLIMKDVYQKILTFFSKNQGTLSFEQIIPSNSKEDKVYTFIPLLHLDTQRRVDMKQKKHFGDIMISLLKKGPLEESDLAQLKAEG
ncbi:MAG: segregation/condensation protein A [archaeon]